MSNPRSKTRCFGCNTVLFSVTDAARHRCSEDGVNPIRARRGRCQSDALPTPRLTPGSASSSQACRPSASASVRQSRHPVGDDGQSGSSPNAETKRSSSKRSPQPSQMEHNRDSRNVNDNGNSNRSGNDHRNDNDNGNGTRSGDDRRNGSDSANDNRSGTDGRNGNANGTGDRSESSARNRNGNGNGNGNSIGNKTGNARSPAVQKVQTTFCRKCLEYFVTKGAMREHMREKHSIPCSSPLCGYVALDRAKMAEHERRTHGVPSPERPYVCSVCSGNLKSQAALTLHLRKFHQTDG